MGEEVEFMGMWDGGSRVTVGQSVPRFPAPQESLSEVNDIIQLE